ncbi:hypothetical protein C4J65_32845 [Streptomyces sp. CB09001]|nr:hypothetical protein C4J65_32845 [Streptomyces sp. CB09001]
MPVPLRSAGEEAVGAQVSTAFGVGAQVSTAFAVGEVVPPGGKAGPVRGGGHGLADAGCGRPLRPGRAAWRGSRRGPLRAGAGG